MSTWEDDTSMAQYDGAVVRKYWCSDGINQVGADNRRFRTYQRLSALRAEHRSRSTIFCPPRLRFVQQHQERTDAADKGYDGSSHLLQNGEGRVANRCHPGRRSGGGHQATLHRKFFGFGKAF